VEGAPSHAGLVKIPRGSPEFLPAEDFMVEPLAKTGVKACLNHPLSFKVGDLTGLWSRPAFWEDTFLANKSLGLRECSLQDHEASHDPFAS